MNTNMTNLLHQDGIAIYYEKAIPENQIKQLFDELFNNISWENERVVMFGKEIITKRKVAFYSDPSIAYTYSSRTKIGLPWKEVAKTVWDKGTDGYTFKKSHAISYSWLVAVHMNLLG